jgi:catechol 2,3-dioxygenase-like lactoylglutathione lyase family enzyme
MRVPGYAKDDEVVGFFRAEKYLTFERGRSVEAMMIRLDHVGVPVRNAAVAAAFLAEILGLAPATPEGPEGEMAGLAIGESGVLLFCPAERVAGQHIAFRVDATTFAGVVDRLRARGVAFGNHPEDLSNGQTADPHGGGQGRVYFLDPHGHLFEVVA